MCGIIGLWEKHKVITKQRLLEAACTLNHRGPDSQHVWLTADKHLGLAHTRLSIIDLTTGNQPLHSSDGFLHAVVNGEFYDYQEIRANLMSKGYHFRTHSDSEILLYLYQEYGTDCLKYLNGEFAFILFDERNQLLFAARDRFGIKPLFYSLFNGTIFLASECKAILKLGVPPKWNLRALWYYLKCLPLQSLSLFEHINYLKPGHYLLAQLKNFSISEKCYWNLAYSSNPSYQKKHEKKYISQFQELFSKAVDRRLKADVPVGCYLSGGIDSAAVTVIASEICQQPLTAFTVAFEDSADYNELNYAKALAKQLNIKLIAVPVTLDDIVQNFGDTLWHTEWPIMNGAPVGKYLLSKRVNQEGYRVVLTGEGSDELLAGYPLLWQDCLKFSSDSNDQQIAQQMEALNKLFLNSRLSKRVLANIQKRLGYVPALLEETVNPYLNLVLSDDFKNSYSHEKEEISFLNNVHLPSDISTSHVANYLQIKSIFPLVTLNIFGDRVEMAHSVEGRTPFLDKDLVDFICTLPNHMLANGLVEKYILREAMKNKVNTAIYHREKHAYHAPTTNENKKGNHQSPIYEFMKEIFYSQMMANLPFIDRRNLQLLFNQFLNKNRQDEALVILFYSILSLALMSDRFGI